MSGAVLDFVIDIRIGSPAFGTWDAVRLDSQDRAAVYLSEGLGHAFLALTDEASVVYLCSEVYNPTAEHGINPLDPALDLDLDGIRPLLSDKDAAAGTLEQAAQAGALPSYEACLRYYADLRAGGSATTAEPAP